MTMREQTVTQQKRRGEFREDSSQRSMDLAYFEAMLLRTRESMVKDLHSLRESLRQQAEEHSQAWEIGSVDDLTAVQASENAALQIRRLTETLDQLHGALARIKKGTYGLCSRCEGPIEKERLEVLPYTRLCIRCMKT